MSNKTKNIILIAVISLSLGLATNAAVKNVKTPTKAPVTVQKAEPTTPSTVYVPTSSLDIVANPTKYLNQKVKIKAKFDKFSTLGLDYKPAYRSSEKFITFLIKRDNVTSHTVPLSEMKNFLPREVAEKYIDLSTDDEIEYCGTVFSNALGDAWINVEKFTVLSQKPKEQKPAKK